MLRVLLESFAKNDGSAFYQIKQKGLENYSLIKAISILIANREPNIKADITNSYQLSLSSKKGACAHKK